MDQKLIVVIGMSIMYLFSLVGLIIAYISYKRRSKKERP